MPELGDREVLVRVSACGICASDLKFYKGLKSYRETPFGWGSPGFTGHEWAGVVVETGSKVTMFSGGEVVVPYIIRSCGICKYCRMGRENLCSAKSYIHGGFSEYIKVPEHNLIRVPDGVVVEDACLTEPIACCLNAFEQLNLKRDDTVVIIGDGAMGLLNLLIAKRIGARVILIGHHTARIELSKRLGADLTINSTETNPIEAVRDATEGYGADAVILTISNFEAVTSGFNLVSRGGSINIFAGAHPDYELSISPNRIHYSELKIIGSVDGLRKHYLEALELIRSGQIKPSVIVTHVYPLERIGEAFDMLERRAVIKALVKPGA